MIPRSTLQEQKEPSQIEQDDAAKDLYIDDDVLSLSADPSRHSDIPETWIIED